MVNVNITTNIVASNTVMLGRGTINLKLNRYMRRLEKERKKEYLKYKRDAFLKKEFDKAWDSQRERLSKVEQVLRSKSEYMCRDCYKEIYEYKNGQISKEVFVTPEYSINDLMYDERGNCVYNSDNWYSCTYYPDSDKKEFERHGDEIKHFDKDGKEDTQTYYLRKKIASKRLDEEEKTGVKFKKASKLEKAISKALVDKPEMTLIEKILSRKARKR